MRVKFGAYLILPLKYEDKEFPAEMPEPQCEKYPLKTMDINENVKNMFNGDGEQAIGKVYRVSRETLISHLCGTEGYGQCQVCSEGMRYPFDILDSYLYIFHTRIAFLCLGLSFSQMDALYAICNPGYAENESQFRWVDTDGTAHLFSLGLWLEDQCADWGLQKFYGGSASILLEAYTYVLALTDTAFSTLEELRRITFNLHKMQNLDVMMEDDSEADIRYVYAAKNPALNAYRWGCCVTSQTIAYAVADRALDFQPEMDTQAADGMPIVLLALYEKYTCLRFTELIAESQTQKLKPVLELKKLMLKFQAFGTVTPANLSRWNNVKQIYAYLLEVGEIAAAVQDISIKINILAEQQQEIESQRSARIVNLITIFGIVGIMSSVQSIVQILAAGSDLMWSVTLLTMAVMALCVGLAMKK